MADAERRPEDFGRYLLVDLIGRGGMAEVFQARLRSEGSIHKTVVLKRILPHLSDEDAFVRMFRDEAKLTLRMNHANVVQVFDFGYHAGHWYLVMEWVHGNNLRDVMQRAAPWGPFPVGLALFIAAEAARGLAHAHGLKDDRGESLGLVHRDVTPHNVLISFDGAVKVADFGIAKARNRLTETNPGIVKGKVPYVAPEQAAGRGIDARSDVYAIGVVLWEMLAGTRLVEGANELVILGALAELEEHPLVSTKRPVSPEIDALIASALAADPAKRTATAQKFAKEASKLAIQHGGDVDALAAAMERWFKQAPPRNERDTAELESLAAKMLREKLREVPPRLESATQDPATVSGTRMFVPPKTDATRTPTPKVPKKSDEITRELKVRAIPKPDTRVATESDRIRAGMPEPPMPAPPASPSRPMAGAVQVDLTGRFDSLETFFLEGYATFQGGGRGLFIQGTEGHKFDREQPLLIGLSLARPQRSFVLHARVLWHRKTAKVEGGRRKPAGTALRLLPGLDRDRLYDACGLSPEPEEEPPEITSRALVSDDISGCDLVAEMRSPEVFRQLEISGDGALSFFFPTLTLDLPMDRVLRIGVVFHDPAVALAIPGRVIWQRRKPSTVRGKVLPVGNAIQLLPGAELEELITILNEAAKR